MRDHFFVRDKTAFHKISFHSILYIEVDWNHVNLVTETKTIVIRQTLKEVLTILPQEHFCRIHRSYAVAVSKVIAFSSEKLIVSNETELPIGKFYKAGLFKKVWVLGDLLLVKKNRVPPIKKETMAYA